ncbi:MAG: hypothetical protein EOP51_16870 [Sphingobacteriales bacterium]|nr:MAG: hypothetical protein EOP51_16870 [Sphingobacteriales bacterium]
MELDELRSAWNTNPVPVKTAEEIKLMLQENKHPVLKGIRKQIIIEVTAWVAFLTCYYTMFDGDRKPLYINAILVACGGLAILHNLMGYSFSRFLINGTSLKQSVQNYLSKVKIYGTVSVAARVLYATALLVYFSYGIDFNRGKYYLLGVAILAFATNLFLLGRLWVKRWQQLAKTVVLFD